MSIANGNGVSRLLDAREVAEMLGMTPQWVYAESRAGRIPHIKLGRYRRFRQETVEKWIEELEREGVR